MMRRSIPRRLSRRTLLRGAVGGVALPLMEAMMPKRLRAQTAMAPKRFGVMFSPCGTIPESWRSTGNNPTVAAPTPTNPAISTNFTLSPVLAPLQPYQSDIIVLRGVNMETTQPQYGPVANVHDQGMTHQLTAIGLVKGPAGAGRANHFLDGSAGGPSIDQHLAESIGKTTLLPSLQLGVETSSTFLEPLVTRMCYGKVVPAVINGTTYPLASVVPSVDDPVAIYTRLFGTATMGTTDQITRALMSQKSVLDFVMNDYTDLQGRLGSADKGKLDQHLTNIRDIEKRLSQMISTPGGGGTCPGRTTITPMTPARTQCLRDQDLRTPAELMNQTPNFCVTDYVGIGKMQLDLMVLALTCDLTRVASMQWSTGESTVIHTWLNQPIQFMGTKEHHMLTHNESPAATLQGSKVSIENQGIIRGDLAHIHNWYATQFAYLIGKLKAVQEGNGTLLDNTLMFWSNELGVGGTHEYSNVPYVLAGKMFTPGRYIDFLGNKTAALGTSAGVVGSGPPHNQLFVSFLQKFGVNETTFGDKHFTGPLPGL